MSHFAEVIDGVVTRVIVADQAFIDKELLGPKENWVQTSYNTHKNVHARAGQGKSPLRKNYAGVGYTYDPVGDGFHAPKPYPSWTLDADTFQWDPPTPMPVDENRYAWDEDTLAWVIVEAPV
jgi:hypothetical protein